MHVCVCVCVCVFNREISIQESINSSSKSLYMGVEVEIHILVIFFSFFTDKWHFFKHLFCKQKGEGHTSVLSAQKWNHGEMLPT